MLQNGRDRAPVDQGKVARVVRDGQVREGIEEAIEEFVAEAPEERRVPLHPPPENDVKALLPFAHEIRDELRRILKVAIEQHAGVLGRNLHAAAKSSL